MFRLRRAALLVAAAFALVACASVPALAKHHHHQHAAPAAAAQHAPATPAAQPSLSQMHPRAQPGNTADPKLVEPLPQPDYPRSKALRGSRPNLVYIMADDSGFGDLGANGYGADTPFLDKLAAGGLRMTDFHSGSSICTPSRANVMTGRLGLRTGVFDLFWPESAYGLPLNETTIAEMLLQANYSTAIIGKWHLGHADGHHPSYRGFEQTFGLPWGPGDGCLDCFVFDIHPAFPTCKKDPVGVSFAEVMWSTAYKQHVLSRDLQRPNPLTYDGLAPANLLYDVPAPRCESSDNADFGAEEPVAHASDEEFTMPAPQVTKQCNQWILEQPVNLTGLTDKYAAKQNTYISGWAKAQRDAKAAGVDPKPFFLYVPLSHMHAPLYFDNRWAGTSKQQTVYGDTLREMDFQVQSLYQSLEAEGLLDNTLIIYSSDNGPWDIVCYLGGSPGPFNGTWQKTPEGGGGGATSKLTTWEAGHRVPAIAYWQGKIAPGVSSALGSHLDIVPTFMALAGAPLPTDRVFDGLDLSPVLFDGATALHETLFHAQITDGGLTAMRYHQYKAFWRTYAVPSCNDTNTGKVQIFPLEKPLVFDLSVDPAEANPLTNVDPALYAKLAELHNQQHASIFGTPHSWANFTLGGTENWPCCNPNHVTCRCED